MAKRDKFVHLDMNAQEVQNVSWEKLGAHPTGAGLYKGRYWMLTVDDRVYYYDGAAIQRVTVAEDLNKFGALIGSLDATAGIPTVGSGVDSKGVTLAGTASIQAGDFWKVSVAGTIVGIEGADELSIGDELVALQDNATLASHFLGIQVNVNDASLGGLKDRTKTAALVANTPLSFSAEMAVAPAMVTAKMISVINDATGEDITSGLRVDYTAKEVESNIAIASVTIFIIGS
jgi:hypothetical protein